MTIRRAKSKAATISTSLTVVGQGETMTFDVTYHNHTPAEVAEKAKAATVGELMRFLVHELDTEYGTDDESIAEMERDWPGLSTAIVQGFYEARQVQLQKN